METELQKMLRLRKELDPDAPDMIALSENELESELAMGTTKAEAPEPLDDVKRMEWDYCPSCAGELDTGFECNTCGRDWRQWAMLYFNVQEVETDQ